MHFTSLLTGLLATAVVSSPLGTYAAPAGTALVTRQAGGTAADVLGSFAELGSSLLAQHDQDNYGREQFTKDMVDNMFVNDNCWNYVIVHTSFEFALDGTEGQDWAHSHHEFDIKVGGTIGFELFVFRSGTFTLTGDGGYINWAFVGYVVNDDGGDKPRVIQFGTSGCFSKRETKRQITAPEGYASYETERYTYEVAPKIKEDAADRSDFTQKVVEEMFNINNKFNYVVVYTDREVDFVGNERQDWSASPPFEWSSGTSETVQFTLYAFKEGTFTLTGDGGYLNWAWKGYISSEENDGKTLHFSAPPA